MRTAIVFLGVFVGLIYISSTTCAAESAAYQHLKDLECFIGTWEGKTVMPSSSTSSKSLTEWSGRTALSRINVKWAAGKAAQIVETVTDIEGAAKITETLLRGWDQSLKKIKESSFTTHKGVWAGAMAKDGDTWVLEYTGVNLDGQQCKGVRKFEFLDKDTFVAKDTNQTVGGKAFPDIECQFKRVGTMSGDDKLTQAESNRQRQKYFDLWKPHAGEWDIVMKEPGSKDITGIFSYQPLPTKLGYIGRAKSHDGSPMGDGIYGYDPERKCWVDVEIFRMDDSYVFATTLLRADVDGELREGTSVALDVTIVMNGKTTKFTATRVYKTVAKDRIVMVHRNRTTKEGASLPDMTWVYERRK